MLEEFDIFEKFLRKNSVEPRQARNWAVVGIFANMLCKEYFPEYNYMERLVKEAAVNQEEQLEDSTVVQFWEYVEGMQSAERPVITSDHLKREGNHLFMWYAEIFRLFEKDSTYTNKQKFSKNAVLAALKEEEYFVAVDRKSLGMSDNVRRCIVLDINKGPIPMQTIARFLDN